MKKDRRQFISSSLLTAGVLSLPASSISAQDKDKDKTTVQTNTLSLRGRVICLTEEFKNLYQLKPDCDNRGHVYSLKTSDGKYYPLLPTDSAAAVWTDQRYRERDLQLTARSFPQTSFIEVIKFQSWVNGKLHDLYYFCDVCMISSHKPGPCDCCQDPYQFRETPAETNK